MNLKSALRDVNNAVLDLQSADYNTFERPLEKLSLALQVDDLKPITEKLLSKADLDKFLESANEGGSMMGSARLIWPSGREEELGLVIHLIHRAAQKPHWFSSLAHTYYYSGRKIVASIRKITTSVIIPFNRDFASYAEDFVPDQRLDRVEESVCSDEDLDDFLKVLCRLAQKEFQRPSAQDARMQFFPDWEKSRFIAVLKRLEEEGFILNVKGAKLNVDISSTGRKRVEKLAQNVSGNVTYNIGEMNNSPLQHNAVGANGIQNTSFAGSDLRAVLALYKDRVDELGLDTSQRRRADAQVATIEAQLMDEPDPTIISVAGRSLKTIVEGAIGGAAGNALTAAAVWAPLLTMFS